jgi:UV DNA damage endonuclease
MHIHQRIGIPIVFDYHHHQCQQDPMSQEDALKLAASTWPIGIPPVVHYSESKALHENDPKIKVQAHSDYITALPNTYGVDVDIMVEAKKKDWAIIPFLHLQSQNKLAA